MPAWNHRRPTPAKWPVQTRLTCDELSRGPDSCLDSKSCLATPAAPSFPLLSVCIGTAGLGFLFVPDPTSSLASRPCSELVPRDLKELLEGREGGNRLSSLHVCSSFFSHGS